MPFVRLIPHPSGPADRACALAVEFERQGRALWLRFIVEGDPDAIVWPGIMAPTRADGLWQNTCFEAFVSTGEGYREFNLSPSGQWAAYRFTGYREGMGLADEGVIVDGLDGGEDYMALEGRIELPGDGRRLALSAVLEGIDGEKTYWALAHPSDMPDFHHPDSFALELPAPEPAGTEQP